MKSGHVGADYVENVLRKQGSSRPRQLIRLGDEALDSIALSEPDLSAYDTTERE